jgi:hypothetical protein
MWQYWNQHPRVISRWQIRRRFQHTLFLLGFQFSLYFWKGTSVYEFEHGVTRNARITAWSTFNICCYVGRFCSWFAGLWPCWLCWGSQSTRQSWQKEHVPLPLGLVEWLETGCQVVSPQIKVNTQWVLMHSFRKLVCELYISKGHTRNDKAAAWISCCICT